MATGGRSILSTLLVFIEGASVGYFVLKKKYTVNPVIKECSEKNNLHQTL